jgi:nitroreductase
MDTLEAISTRRSIRLYTGQPIASEIIEKLLRAAMQAPSAGNQQPWQFVVVAERARLNALAEALPYGKMLQQAAAGVVVCGDLGREKSAGYWVQDCSAATQNLLLAAHALGLGAVWIGVYPRDDRVRAVQARLGLPEGVIPLCVVALGYPAEQKGGVDRYDESRVHWNQW